MTTLSLALLGLAAVLVAWSYLVYPALVLRLARRVSLRPIVASPPPSVDVLVSAYDEEASIGPRVVNLLALRYPGSLSVMVGCDGCRDWTAVRAREAARGLAEERVHVAEFAERRGKAAVLNELVRRSKSEVLVFTDANSTFAPDAVARLVEHFGDPSVGAVCGRLILEPLEGVTAPAETEFWDRETRLKEAEGQLGVCLGANGAIYAARRSLVRPLPGGTVLDDFLIPARIVGEGHRAVFARDAVARELLPPDVKSEASRRFRIGIGAGRILRREWWLFDPRRRPLVALVFLSRKAARWLAPVAACAAVAFGLFSPALQPLAIAAAALIALLAASLALRRRPAGRPGRLYYFGVINLALAAGVVAGLVGFRRTAWPRTAR